MFFFKQQPPYERRISDWSSDVCSSDLLALAGIGNAEEGVRQMVAAFAAHGLTGVVDGGGLMVTPRDYDPLYAVWRRGDLDVRTRLYISAWTRGGEVENSDRLTTLVQPGSGDGMLRNAGVGEIRSAEHTSELQSQMRRSYAGL